MAISLLYSSSGIISGKKFVEASKWRPFWKTSNAASFWPQISKDRPTLCKKVFFVVMTSSMTSQDGLKIGPLYSCLGEARSGSRWQGQWLVNTCEYRTGLSRLYMPQKVSINNTLPKSQVKYQRHRFTGWPWHLNGHNSANVGITKMKQQCKNSHSYVATATKIRFYFQFPRPPDAECRGWWSLNWKSKFGCIMISNIANHVKCNRIFRWWRHR